MSEERDDQERPCLHCMIVELIDDFFAEYPANTGESDTIDTNEVITAIAKTMAELTCSQDGAIRQQLIERLMSEIMNYDTQFRRDDGTGAMRSNAWHTSILNVLTIVRPETLVRWHRLIGSIRWECLDHIVVTGEQHLCHILKCYMEYYNAVRTHLSLGKDAPIWRDIQCAGRIEVRPVLGGLHHEYVRI
jgi:hypothetical protein